MRTPDPLPPVAAAERVVSFARLAVVALVIGVYLLVLEPMPGREAAALGALVGGFAYALWTAVFVRARRPRAQSVGAAMVAADGAFVALLVWGTGGGASPFQSLWFASLVAAAFRHDHRTTLAATFAYAALHVATALVPGPAETAPLVVGTGLIVAVGALAALLSRERSVQVRAASEMEAHMHAARAAEARFRALLEASPDPTVIVDHDARILRVNTALGRAFGYTPDELVGAEVEILVPGPLRTIHRAHRDGFMRDPKARPMGAGRDLLARRKDGSRVPVEIALSPLPTSEGLVVIASIRDVTESRRARETLERYAAELRRSNAELEQFAYVASHDLQEPLRMVGSYVQLLEKRYKGKLDADADEFIRFAVDGARRMQTLIHDLLDYSRIGTQGKPLGPTDVGAALDTALSDLSMRIQESGATVTRGDLPVVMADPAQLAQVFLNLIGNATKFRGNDPPRVHVSAERTGNSWRIDVADNGIGIDPAHADRIFVIFQRLHARETYPGTGMGLAICKKIVERHGGRIWVDPTPGGGSTFRFTLPPAPEPAALRRAPVPVPRVEGPLERRAGELV